MPAEKSPVINLDFLPGNDKVFVIMVANIAIPSANYARTKIKKEGNMKQNEVSAIINRHPDSYEDALFEIFQKIATAWNWARIVRVAVDQAIAGDAAARQWISRLLLPEGKRTKGHAAARALQILTHASQDLKVTFRKASQEIELTRDSDAPAPCQGVDCQKESTVKSAPAGDPPATPP